MTYAAPGAGQGRTMQPPHACGLRVDSHPGPGSIRASTPEPPMSVRTLLVLACAGAACAADATTAATKPAAATTGAATATATWDTRQKASYLVGLQMAESVRHYQLDAVILQQAIADTVAGRPPAVDKAEAQSVLGAYQAELEGAKAKAGAERKVGNKAWLDDNAKKPGVKVTASGLQYQVVSEGAKDGKKPTASDKVKVNYTGALTDGTVFDASAAHGGPATFGVGQVIKGWTEALQLMKPGDKYKLYIPAELAYGEQAPPNIGPNQILVFDVELLEVLGGGPETLKP